VSAGSGRQAAAAHRFDHEAIQVRHLKDGPLAVDPRDEGLHQPGPERVWSESYYFDAVSDDEKLGVYVRLARLPNQDACLYTAAIVGPGRSPVLVVAEHAPLPTEDDGAQAVRTERFIAEQECVRPLEEFRVSLSGKGELHADPAAPLLGDRGAEVDVALELAWTTDGIPYRWRAVDRYEVPCRIQGTVRVGAETFVFSGRGQRDHSFGPRDWWSDDWMWSAFHFADGTRLHAVTLPAAPGLAVGYVQNERHLTEIESGTSTFVDGQGGLPSAASIDVAPGGSYDVVPLAFGALLMVADDGRVSHFPRAMARIRALDGATGIGWIEWNRVQG